MSTRTFTRPGPDPFSLSLAAMGAAITVEAIAGLSKSTIELTGPEETLAAAVATEYPGTWDLSLPAEPADRVEFTTARGTISFSSVSGPVQVNGRTLDLLNHGKPPAQRLSAHIRIPTRSAVNLGCLDTGSVTLRGAFHRFRARTTAPTIDTTGADINSVDVRTFSGQISTGLIRTVLDAWSISGAIRVEATAPTTRATTVSGPITAHASGDHSLALASTSGNITVHPGGHRPRVYACSVSGRVRT